MKSTRWLVFLAIPLWLALAPGRAGAQRVLSDFVGIFAAPSMPFVTFFVPEGPVEDPFPFTLTAPINIELVEPDGTISDRLTINTLSGTFVSDSNVSAGPDTGEATVALDMQVNSDTEPSTGTSDVVSFFSKGLPLNVSTQVGIGSSFTRGEGGESTDPLTFSLVAPITINLFDSDGSLSDRITIDQFSGSFLSDDDPSMIQPTPGAFQLPENGNISAFSVRVVSDAVPEPAALCLLPASLLPLGWILWRNRRRAHRTL